MSDNHRRVDLVPIVLLYNDDPSLEAKNEQSMKKNHSKLSPYVLHWHGSLSDNIVDYNGKVQYNDYERQNLELLDMKNIVCLLRQLRSPIELIKYCLTIEKEEKTLGQT